MKVFVLLATVAAISAPHLAAASIRCTTIGNVTRCVDYDTNTTTRCTTVGSVTRCR